MAVDLTAYDRDAWISSSCWGTSKIMVWAGTDVSSGYHAKRENKLDTHGGLAFLPLDPFCFSSAPSRWGSGELSLSLL